jgi:hypothetical protein
MASVTRQRERHGMKHTTEYYIWCHIKERCYSKKSKQYADYGGRGIYMDPQWRRSFLAFYGDMGPRPKGYTIERKNNDGPYASWNCVWATRRQQSLNTRRNIRLTKDGRTQTVDEWAIEMGVPRSTLYSRIRRGWGLDRIL